ncbi:hypothetical protein BHE74_00010967 [Ensete ventricosum]|nr:hypothetical protein BHE74_00010967 [Ensete ventricosum]
MLCEAMPSHASDASCDSKRCGFCYVPLLSRVVLLRDAAVSESGYVIVIALRCVRYFGGGGGTMCGLRWLPVVVHCSGARMLSHDASLGSSYLGCKAQERVGSIEVQVSGLHAEVHDSGARLAKVQASGLHAEVHDSGMCRLGQGVVLSLHAEVHSSGACRLVHDSGAYRLGRGVVLGSSCQGAQLQVRRLNRGAVLWSSYRGA